MKLLDTLSCVTEAVIAVAQSQSTWSVGNVQWVYQQYLGNFCLGDWSAFKSTVQQAPSVYHLASAAFQKLGFVETQSTQWMAFAARMHRVQLNREGELLYAATVHTYLRRALWFRSMINLRWGGDDMLQKALPELFIFGCQIPGLFYYALSPPHGRTADTVTRSWGTSWAAVHNFLELTVPQRHEWAAREARNVDQLYKLITQMYAQTWLQFPQVDLGTINGPIALALNSKIFCHLWRGTEGHTAFHGALQVKHRRERKIRRSWTPSLNPAPITSCQRRGGVRTTTPTSHPGCGRKSIPVTGTAHRAGMTRTPTTTTTLVSNMMTRQQGISPGGERHSRGEIHLALRAETTPFAPGEIVPHEETACHPQQQRPAIQPNHLVPAALLAGAHHHQPRPQHQLLWHHPIAQPPRTTRPPRATRIPSRPLSLIAGPSLRTSPYLPSTLVVSRTCKRPHPLASVTIAGAVANQRPSRPRIPIAQLARTAPTVRDAASTFLPSSSSRRCSGLNRTADLSLQTLSGSRPATTSESGAPSCKF
jgi:hypothetical protein